MPIKDEVNLLERSLSSCYEVGPSEVVLVFDNPPHRGAFEKAKEIAGRYGIPTKFLKVDRNLEWKFHQAWVRRTGFRAAENPVILTTDVDLVLDPQIPKYLALLHGNVGLVSFNKLSYPPAFRYCIANLVQKFYRHKSFTGLYAFLKKAWLETEDLEHLKTQITRAEDTHLHHYLTQKYESRFVNGLKNYCLRPKETRHYQKMQGVNRWIIKRAPWWRALISTFLYVRPYLLIGYLQARYGVVKERIKG